MSDRDEKGRLLPGHKGRNQHSQSQLDQPDTPPPFDGDFDDAIIFIAETYQGKPRSFGGLLAVAEDLRRAKPVDFASYLRQAYANRRDKQAVASSGAAGVTVIFSTAPSGMYIGEDGKLIEAEGARAEWARRTGHQDQPPLAPLPLRPTLVTVARSEERSNEIVFGGDDDGD